MKQNTSSVSSGKNLADSGGKLGEKCAMLAYLINKVSEHHHLSFAERKVLLGVFGHVENGKKVLHDVISRCSDYSSQITDHYISRLKGTPLGCRKIRRMLFYLEGSIPCDCSFTSGKWEYPTPLLHLNSQKTDLADTATGRDDLRNDVCMLKNEITELKKTVEDIKNGNRVHCRTGHTAS